MCLFVYQFLCFLFLCLFAVIFYLHLFLFTSVHFLFICASFICMCLFVTHFFVYFICTGVSVYLFICYLCICLSFVCICFLLTCLYVVCLFICLLMHLFICLFCLFICSVLTGALCRLDREQHPAKLPRLADRQERNLPQVELQDHQSVHQRRGDFTQRVIPCQGQRSSYCSLWEFFVDQTTALYSESEAGSPKGLRDVHI